MNEMHDDELMALAAELPTEIQPDRDLLPEIAARAWRREELKLVPGEAVAPAHEPDSERPGLATALFQYRVPLVAAAVTIVAATAAVTALLVRSPVETGPAQSPVAAVSQPTDAALARYEATWASYAAVIEQLTVALDAHRSELPPATVELIETNLAVIDQALAEAIAALEGSPADASLRRAVAAAYEQKVGLLTQASTLTTGL